MADHPIPPPHELPLAEEAPPALTAFIYYLTRDLLPARYLNALMRSSAEIGYKELGAMDKGLVDYADRLARALVVGYGPTDDQT